MKALKLTAYQETERTLNKILSDLNNIKVNSELKDYIKDKLVSNIDFSILSQQKLNKFSKFSNATELVSLGINLSTHIPDCDSSAVTLAAIEAVKTHYKNYITYFTYTSKGFVLNEMGKQMLEDNTVILSNGEAKLFEMVKELAAYANSINKNPVTLLDITFISPLSFNIDEDLLAGIISK